MTILRCVMAGVAGAAVGGVLSGAAQCKASFVTPHPPNPKNSRCFFDLTTTRAGFLSSQSTPKAIGRVEFELFDDTVPITARNFRELCKGTQGKSPDGYDLHYKGSTFHRVIPGFMCQGGDFTRHNGTGGCSIYGTKFKDEGFNGKAGQHHAPGLLSMANAGRNTNGSQFFLTVAKCPWLDGRHVVFGQVTSGYEVVQAVEALGSASGQASEKITIADCGCISEGMK